MPAYKRCIKQLGPNRFHVRVYIHPGRGGVRTTTVSTYELAKYARDCFFRERIGLPRIFYGEKQMLLSETIASYVARCVKQQRAPGTIEFYKKTGLRLVEGFGPGMRLVDIGRTEVEKYIELRRSCGIGDSTIIKEIKALSMIMEHNGVARSWPKCQWLGLRNIQKPRMVHSMDEIARLWLATPLWARPAIGLGLFAGMRAETALRATADWVNRQSQQIYIPGDAMKKGRPQRMWLCKTLLEVLPESGRLIQPPNRQSSSLTNEQVRNAVMRVLRKASKDIGLEPPIMGHGVFRHHCATFLADLGIDINLIRLVLSHAYGTVTDRYIQTQCITAKREAVEALEWGFKLAIRAAPEAGHISGDLNSATSHALDAGMIH